MTMGINAAAVATELKRAAEAGRCGCNRDCPNCLRPNVADGAIAPYGTRSTTAPWSSSQWREYFRVNAMSLMEIPWKLGVTFTEAEHNAIAASVQQFQLGESSDGVHFIQVAREYAAATGDVQYISALRRFIAEEQRHGRDLARVMDLASIPRISRCWADTFFRWIRKRGGLDLSISVLVTAEFIAQVYYIALRAATESPVLRRLCDQILCDEDEHVRFQCERLAILRRNHRAWRIILKQTLQRFFFSGTCLVFWWKHAPVMRAGGFGFLSFRRAVIQKWRIALQLMDPRSYPTATNEDGRWKMEDGGKRAASADLRGPAPARTERHGHNGTSADYRGANGLSPLPSSTLHPPSSLEASSPEVDLGGKWLEL